MCGIYGFISFNGKRPDAKRLRLMAMDTQTRGKDAFGFIWMTRKHEIFTHKEPGLITKNLDWIDYIAEDCIALIGHCRAATAGKPSDNRNNHPHRAGSGYYVHNGVVRNHKAIAERYGLKLRTSCDSEVIGLMYNRNRGSAMERTANAIKHTQGTGLTFAGMWPKQIVLAHIKGRSLSLGFTGTTDKLNGIYFSSTGAHLPVNTRRKIISDVSYEYSLVDCGRFIFKQARDFSFDEIGHVAPCNQLIRFANGYSGPTSYNEWRKELDEWKLAF